jgi:hypothetical protein
MRYSGKNVIIICQVVRVVMLSERGKKSTIFYVRGCQHVEELSGKNIIRI